MVAAIKRRLPNNIHLAVAIANGTHGPCDVKRLGIDELIHGVELINHDARDADELVSLGHTARGTPVRVNRCVLDADWVIGTGRIKPHYFAGYGAGAKAIYPGLGDAEGIRINHRLKRERDARAGEVDTNPCRLDLEEAARMISAKRFLLNVVLDPSGGPQAAFSGDVEAAFRAGATVCRPLHLVTAPKADVVVISDALPLTGSLYQASKLVAAAAPLVRDGGAVVLVAECHRGTGPIKTVNEKIYEIGLRPRLPSAHRIKLVSDLPKDRVAQTYCEWASTVESVLPSTADIVVLPKGGDLIVEAVSR